MHIVHNHTCLYVQGSDFISLLGLVLAGTLPPQSTYDVKMRMQYTFWLLDGTKGQLGLHNGIQEGRTIT